MAIFALVVIGLISGGLYVISDSQAQMVKNHEHTSRALMLAEEGVVHAVTLLRGPLALRLDTEFLLGADGIANTADDGVLVGFSELAPDIVIPDTGRVTTAGRYQIVLVDDPAETDGDPKTDSNFRILLRCTVTTSTGASARLEGIVRGLAPPAMATDGNLTISGNPTLRGECGGAHANSVAVINGSVSVSTTVSAAGTVVVSGNLTDTLNQPVEPLEHQPPVDIPELDPLAYCATADFVLNANGTVLQQSSGLLFDATSDPKFGWKRASSSPVVWDLSSDNEAVPGTVCAHGNIKVSGNPGSAATPLVMSLIATGSVTISGNPYFKPSHPDLIGILAGGDVQISGNPAAGAHSYEGLVYAGSQCKVSGNPELFGQVLCKDLPNPAGSTDDVSENSVSGNPLIHSDCNLRIAMQRRLVSWYQPM